MLASLLLKTWDKVSREEYADFFMNTSGSISVNPLILDYVHSMKKCNEAFYIKHNKNGKAIVAICVWNKKSLAGSKAAFHSRNVCHHHIPSSTLLLPSTGDKFILPFSTKNLITHNSSAVINSIRFNSGRSLAITKKLSDFSRKTIRKRNSEVNKFLDNGGEIIRVSEFSPKEFTHIYKKLYQSRHNAEPGNMNKLKTTLSNIPDNISGSVLFYKGNPCAIDLVFSSESNSTMFIEFVNGGYDTSLKNIAPRKLLNWINIIKHNEICAQKNKELIGNFGNFYSGYKELWTKPTPLYRVIA